MCALRMQRDGELRGGAVVATVMSNLGLERALAARGLALHRTPVGDRHVVEAMRRIGCNLGGEQSGHLIFLDHASTGDGVIAALQVLALMLRTGRPLSELASEAMERVPQVLENVVLPERRPLEEMPGLARGIQAVESCLGRNGRVLVRWSGTEPKLRIMIEGEDQTQIAAWAQELAAAARKDVGA
jgi:phosphoglucosamine mutase